MNIDDYIRDYNFKIVDGKALIGIEIESKHSESLYYNLLTITFLKDGKEVHKEETDIPLIPAKGLIYVGRSYDFKNFDEIKLHMISIKQVYEDSYYPNVEFGIDNEKTNGKHLEYKVVNNNFVPIPNATLSLLFYNRGELICGTDVKIGKLINGRTYYFVYDVPDDIEYTDINTELTLPNTGYLLFKSYYQEYCNYESEIEDYSEPFEIKKHKQLGDKEKELKDEIENCNKKKKEISKKPGTILKILLFLALTLKNLLLVGFAELVLTLAGFIILIIITLFGLINEGTNLDMVVYIYWGVIAVIGLVIFTFGDLDKYEKFQKHKDRVRLLKEQDDKIASLEKEIEEFKTNKDALEKKIEEENKEIDKENEKIKEKEKGRVEELNRLKEEFKDFKKEYPEYKEFDDYNELDRLLCEFAFQSGAITFDSVKVFRNMLLEKMEEKEKYEQEMAMRRKEQQLMEEQTKAIKENAWAQRYASQQIQAEIAKQASMQQDLIRQQIASNDKIARQNAMATAQVNLSLNDIAVRQQQDMTFYR